MKIEITVPTEVEVKTVRMALAVRYEEEDMPNDYPHRKGDMWNIDVDADTGQIRDWPAGVEPREFNMKVCDEGTYELLGPSGQQVWIKEQDYVPGFVPEGGDYINFSVDRAGLITNWKACCTTEHMQRAIDDSQDD